MSLLFIWYIDKRMQSVLEQYIDVEVERLTNNIVNNAVMNIMNDNYYDRFLIANTDNQNVFYDTVKINSFKNLVTKYIQNILNKIDNGEIEDDFIPTRVRYGKFRSTRNGILCDVSLGSIRNSSVFANVGPSIPIKLIFAGQLSSDIEVDVKEYGINNVIIQMFLVVKIKEQVTMPISSRRKDIIIREPISMEIINGEIPKYYNDLVH